MQAQSFLKEFFDVIAGKSHAEGAENAVRSVENVLRPPRTPCERKIRFEHFHDRIASPTVSDSPSPATRYYKCRHSVRGVLQLPRVGEILPRKYKGGKTDYGVLLPRNSSTNVLAHELGHVVGLKDCFSRTVAMELMVGGDLPVQRGLFKCDGEDWGEETGRGFYPLGDDVESTLASVLMFGYDKGGKDVPANWIKALWENEILEERVREIPVGAHFLELDNGKVYSK